MSTVTIPSTIDGATTALASLDGLITARQWERAAIVWAFTRDQGGRGRPSAEIGRSTDYSFTGFAKLGITGLTTHNTVAAYHRAWQHAIDQGEAKEVKPGQRRVKLPTSGFPPNPDSAAGTSRSWHSRPAEQRAEDVTKALRDPEVAERVAPSVLAKQAARPNVARAIARNDESLHAVEEEGIKHRGRFRPDNPLPDPKQVGEEVRRGMRRVMGTDTDHATDDLHRAAGSLMAALDAKQEWGIDYPEAEAEAIARVERCLEAYKAGSSTRLTDADKDWARENGVEL